MFNGILDEYNLRARLSPGIILISPIILNLYLLIEQVRELSTTIVIFIIAFALSNFLMLVSRSFGSKAIKKLQNDKEFKQVFAQDLLGPNNNSYIIDKITLDRYYVYLNSKIVGLNLSGDLSDEEEIKQKCRTAIKWLKQQTRDKEKFRLIYEENINVGFCRNMYGLKVPGIVICSVLILISILYYFAHGGILSGISETAIIVLAIDISFLIFWIWGINKRFVASNYKKYSIALLAACDMYLMSEDR